jgi:hypothetical protein
MFVYSTHNTPKDNSVKTEVPCYLGRWHPKKRYSENGGKDKIGSVSY